VGESGAPQSLQKRPETTGLPHWGQTQGSAAPHSEQNFPPAFSWLHAEQVALIRHFPSAANGVEPADKMCHDQLPHR
jgi:hypothetical protein